MAQKKAALPAKQQRTTVNVGMDNVGWGRNGWTIGDTRAKAVVNASTVLGLTAFWNGVNIIGNAMGLVCFDVFRRTGQRKKEIDLTHPANDILHYPSTEI